MTDIRELIASRVKDAYEKGCALKIHAGNTKDFYGRNIKGIPLSLSEHTGIVEYEPSELYITARSGTPLKEIEHVIEKENQILPCEPPHFGAAATVGGMVAAGLSGPRRVSSGAIRDCILGVEIINGKGEYLQFGGKVMKNVAGLRCISSDVWSPGHFGNTDVRHAASAAEAGVRTNISIPIEHF